MNNTLNASPVDPNFHWVEDFWLDTTIFYTPQGYMLKSQPIYKLFDMKIPVEKTHRRIYFMNEGGAMGGAFQWARLYLNFFLGNQLVDRFIPDFVEVQQTAAPYVVSYFQPLASVVYDKIQDFISINWGRDGRPGTVTQKIPKYKKTIQADRTTLTLEGMWSTVQNGNQLGDLWPLGATYLGIYSSQIEG